MHRLRRRVARDRLGVDAHHVVDVAIDSAIVDDDVLRGAGSGGTGRDSRADADGKVASGHRHQRGNRQDDAEPRN